MAPVLEEYGHNSVMTARIAVTPELVPDSHTICGEMDGMGTSSVGWKSYGDDAELMDRAGSWSTAMQKGYLGRLCALRHVACEDGGYNDS